MNEIIQVRTSAELYRLISRENLHLRRGFGRDDALHKQLAQKLGLDLAGSIPTQLESKKISVEDFVQAFFSVTEPFAKMMNNNYSIMEHLGARSAIRSVRMKFSFQNASEKLEFDLKHFRELLATYRKLRDTFTVRLWSQDDIARLFHPVQAARALKPQILSV